MPQGYIELEKAADELNLSPMAIQHLIDEGELPNAYEEDGRWLIPISELNSWLKKGTVFTPPPRTSSWRRYSLLIGLLLLIVAATALWFTRDWHAINLEMLLGNLPIPMASPQEIVPRTSNEILVIVAAFPCVTGLCEHDPGEVLYEQLVQNDNQRGNPDYRVEYVEAGSYGQHDVDEVRKELLKRYDASMVFWGEASGRTVELHVLNGIALKQSPASAVVGWNGHYAWTLYEFDEEVQFALPYLASYLYSDQGNIVAAIEQMELAIATLDKGESSERSELVRLYDDLGYLLRRVERNAEAITMITLAIENADFPSATRYYNRGVIYSDSSQFEAAESDYLRAIELLPEWSRPYLGLAVIHDFRGEYEEAVARYSEAITRDNRYIRAYVDRGNSYRWLEDQAAAIADYSKAIELDPTYHDAYLQRGNLYLEMDSFQLAKVDFETVLELAPEDADGHYGLGVAYHELRDCQTAILHYSSTIELEPSFAEAYFARGSCRGRLRERELAHQDYLLAVEWAPGNWRFLDQLGESYVDRGELEEALNVYVFGLPEIEDEADRIMAEAAIELIRSRLSNQDAWIDWNWPRMRPVARWL